MKKILMLVTAFLLLGVILVSAGAVKIPIYNPFGRHLQYVATGFDNALVKDVVWTSSGTSTTLNVSVNTTETLIQLDGNFTALNFPSSGVLIIGSEAILYYNWTISGNSSAWDTTNVSIEKRGAYGTTAASHTNATNVYFIRFLIGTDNSTAPWFSVNTRGYTGFGDAAPQDKIVISDSTESNSQIIIGRTDGILNVNLAVPGIEIGATSGNTAITLGINGTDYGQIVWYADSSPDYMQITATAGRVLALQTNGGNVGIYNTTPNHMLSVRGNIYAKDNITGGIDWTNLQSYPAACPTGYAITTLGDAVTCTEFISFAANINMRGYSIYNATWVNVTNLNASNVYATSFVIGADIITTSEFAYLDGLDQNVATVSNVTFNNITVAESQYIGGNLDVAGNITGLDVFTKTDCESYSSTIQTITNVSSYKIINFETNVECNKITTDGQNFTLQTVGEYKVSVDLQADKTGGSSTTIESVLFLDDVQINGSARQRTINSNNEIGFFAINWDVITTSVNQILTVGITGSTDAARLDMVCLLCERNVTAAISIDRLN